jgi:hypothetical protein
LNGHTATAVLKAVQSTPTTSIPAEGAIIPAAAEDIMAVADPTAAGEGSFI